MTEPTRLADDPTDGFEASLIRAGRRDGPSPAVRRAAALAGGAMAATLLAPKASAATSTLKTITVMSAKGFLAGALLTGAMVAAPRLLASPSPSTAHAVDGVAQPSGGHVYSVAPAHLADSVPVASGAPAAHAVEGRELAPGASGNVRAASGRGLASKPHLAEAREPRPAETTTGVAVSPGGLGEEIRAFERARQAFASGNVGAATAALDAYERDFRHGSLSLEAEVLRIEILEASDKGTAARAHARAFLEAHPWAPAARRVRNLLSHSGSGEGP